MSATNSASKTTFQARVQPWMLACFGEMIAGDREERNHRFLEEALELVQSTGCTASEAHQLVEYVYGRPVGEPVQEVGGVMVTLAALCQANHMDMHACAEIELARIWTKVEKIRAKQAAKPKHSPLPEVSIVAPIERHLTITTNEQGACVAVSWQDDEHRILELVWQAPDTPAGAAQTPAEPAFYINPQIIDPATGKIGKHVKTALTWSERPLHTWSAPVYLAAANAAPATPQADGFRGDNKHLVSNINALLSLDASGALGRHGIGGHARTMLTAAARRLDGGVSELVRQNIISEFLASTGKYVTNDASREAAIKAAVDKALEPYLALASACYAGLGAECNLPENWLDVLLAAAERQDFSVDGLLPFRATPPAAVKPEDMSEEDLNIHWPMVGTIIEAHMSFMSQHRVSGTSDWGAFIYKALARKFGDKRADDAVMPSASQLGTAVVDLLGGSYGGFPDGSWVREPMLKPMPVRRLGQAVEAVFQGLPCNVDARAFKNFHKQLCLRFNYTHDEQDWRRDQVSLIEFIARKAEL